MDKIEKELLSHLRAEVKFLRQTVKSLTETQKAQPGLSREEAMKLQDAPSGGSTIMEDLMSAVGDIHNAEDLTEPLPEG